ncbi:MAG: glycine oxidase ThiO [Planctomycetia bacterium]|nr:glycine oxidase ThiO [Planctomycetia bacterium]
MHDIIIIGGGVIGLSLACELAGEGTKVAVLEKGGIGQESSWAGAGILPPGNPDGARTPEARLRACSHVLWADLSARLREETGIDNGFRRTGGLEVRIGGPVRALEDEVAAWRAEGVTVEPLAGRAVFEREGELHPEVTSAYRLPEMGQVRNPRHLKALAALALLRNVSLMPGTEVHRFELAREKAVAIETSAGRCTAGQFVVAGGAWSGRLLNDIGCPVAVRPLRGQIVLLSMLPTPLSHVVNVGPRYFVPRGDGRVLVGATEEAAGFDKSTTAGGVAGLMDFSLATVPALARATFERCWAGLRPQSADGLPYLGRVPQADNLFVATGHFRAGLQLSPATALLMSQLILGRETRLPLEPYSVTRHAGRRPEFFDQETHSPG